MTAKVKALRIFLLSIAITGLAALVFVLVFRQPATPSVATQPGCLPLPPNIEKLGPVLVQKDGVEALAEYGEQESALRKQLRPGDAVHTFETGVTGGHLVMRGNCFIGQAVAWIR